MLLKREATAIATDSKLGSRKSLEWAILWGNEKGKANDARGTEQAIYLVPNTILRC